MARERVRPDLPEERKRRSLTDAIATRITDKEGNVIYDGRELYKKKKGKEE